MELEVCVHRPAAPLDNYVERFWHVRHTELLTEKLLPTSCTDVIFSFASAFQVEDPLKSKQNYHVANAWFGGPRTRFALIKPLGPVDLLGVRFFPGGAGLLFGKQPLSDLTDVIPSLESVLGSKVKHWREELGNLQTPTERFHCLERLLASCVDPSPDWYKCVRYSHQAFGGNTKTFNLKRLSDRLGFSTKHVIALFRNRLGVTPSTAYRVVRFERTSEQLFRNDGTPLGELAIQMGYSDQSHFIREFRHFAGITPRAWLSLKNRTNYYELSDDGTMFIPMFDPDDPQII